MRRDSKRLCLLRDGNLLAAAMGRCIAAGSVLEHILPRYINVAIVWHMSERQEREYVCGGVELSIRESQLVIANPSFTEQPSRKDDIRESKNRLAVWQFVFSGMLVEVTAQRIYA